MKVVSGLSDAALSGPCVLSIGNFDGLHLGHRRILRTVVERARQLRVTPAVLTFDPHPVRVLAPQVAPKLISTLRQKIRLIESAGIDVLFIARFDMEFAALTPEAFVQRYLIDGLHAKALCVGANFTFGHKQAGTTETLRHGAKFEVIEVPSVSFRGTVVSSTQIRNYVQSGDVSRAGRLLGRWLEIEGQIVSGDGRGRNVTVPTINLQPENELIPKQGVYVTRASVDSGPFVDAITNIGTRPTFGGTAQTIETFVLRGSVVDRPSAARLQFLHRMRDERKFDSPELLKDKIRRDVANAMRFFRMLEAGHNAGIHSN